MKKWMATAAAAVIALILLFPFLVTVADSFLSLEEIRANYGTLFADAGRGFLLGKINLKLIPDMVSLSQYGTVLFRTPEYLLKLWNSLFLVVPIVVFQLIVACMAAYGFLRARGKLWAMVFFGYIVLMLMPTQVTLVPNFLVADWLGLTDTYWAIWLPGIFSPFSVYLMTRYMKRIPGEIIEAAKADGAGTWTVLVRILVPMCRGVLSSCALLLFLDYWNMVEQPMTLLADPDRYPLSVFLSQIQVEDVGIAFAAAVVYMIPSLLIFLYCEEDLEEGIVVAGGIKS